MRSSLSRLLEVLPRWTIAWKILTKRTAHAGSWRLGRRMSSVSVMIKHWGSFDNMMQSKLTHSSSVRWLCIFAEFTLSANSTKRESECWNTWKITLLRTSDIEGTSSVLWASEIFQKRQELGKFSCPMTLTASSLARDCAPGTTRTTSNDDV